MVGKGVLFLFKLVVKLSLSKEFTQTSRFPTSREKSEAVDTEGLPSVVS